MSHYNSNQLVLPASELAATMTGAWIPIGTILFPPEKIIFDNQGTVPIAISINDGLTTWRTFPAGEALILDNDLGTFSAGTIFYGNGASGIFSISYTYVRLN